MASRTALARLLGDRHHRQPHGLGAFAEKRERIFGRRRIGLDEQRGVQRHQLVLQLERAGIIALEARGLEFGAQPRRHVRSHRDAAMAAMRHEAERGRVFARELVEVLAHRRALLRHPHHIRGRVLHAGDVLKLVQPLHRVDRHVDHRARRDIVDDDRNADRIVDRLEVLIEAFLRRLVVIGRDHEHRVGAGLFGVLGKRDRLLGRVRAGAGDDRHAALAPGRRTIRPPRCARRARASGFRRWCRLERARLVPSAICQSTKLRKAFSSRDPFLNGVTSAVNEPRKLVLALMIRSLRMAVPVAADRQCAITLPSRIDTGSRRAFKAPCSSNLPSGDQVATRKSRDCGSTAGTANPQPSWTAPPFCREIRQ